MKMKGKNFISLGMILISLVIGVSLAAGKDITGAVYTMTNSAAGNEIVIFDRDAKGMLTSAGSISTGGLGSGGGLDPLGSQNSLLLSPDGRWLLAVNAGSDEISLFRVLPDGLVLADKVFSGGNFPVSLTIFHNLVYVLNAGGTPNITGFILTHTGELFPIADSTRSLGAGGFAQVGFDPQGRMLVVTDRANRILVFLLGKDGTPSIGSVISPSSGPVPFGFVFDQRGYLLVSEASGAVSSYDILSDRILGVISGSVTNGQTATCWIAANAQFVFAANTGSNTISVYKVKAGKGILTLLDPIAGSGDLPIDLAVGNNGRFLYVLNAGDGSIGMFQINPEGILLDLGRIEGGLSIHAQGMAAR
jgi:6-phosphogluconolactonase